MINAEYKLKPDSPTNEHLVRVFYEALKMYMNCMPPNLRKDCNIGLVIRNEKSESFGSTQFVQDKLVWSLGKIINEVKDVERVEEGIGLTAPNLRKDCNIGLVIRNEKSESFGSTQFVQDKLVWSLGKIINEVKDVERVEEGIGLTAPNLRKDCNVGLVIRNEKSESFGSTQFVQDKLVWSLGKIIDEVKDVEGED
ncbi:hypothetical protein Bhyg_02868 [Pseudolycoriella hygida]|uniref:Uncharacterized protein n=1 Tax=Pseudolycoriella hygida TaxID=35572 RepID=A0A9Q0S8T4_9DIPT|nr:hypothetical protein Bhyg_02868 [Pseudolycoriella hygida]